MIPFITRVKNLHTRAKQLTYLVEGNDGGTAETRTKATNPIVSFVIKEHL